MSHSLKTTIQHQPETHPSGDRKSAALAYLDAVAKHQFDRLETLLAPDLLFKGPTVTRTTAADYIGALKGLAVIHLRSDVRRVFADGDEACIIYDFVTDTAAGAVPIIEWLHFEGERIRAIDLFYDRLPWQTVTAVMAERTTRQPVA